MPDTAVFSALREFQKDHGITPTGTAKPGDETVKALSKAASVIQTGKYIWRTVGDDKVRSAHASLNGTIRDFSDSPDPGEEFNCRCWAELLSHSAYKAYCSEQKVKYETAQRRVAELTERFHDLLLQLDELHEKNNVLIQKARKNLGSQVVAYILTLPFERLDVLNELLRRYLGNIISNEFLKAADNFMQQVRIVKQEVRYTEDQTNIVGSMLKKSAKELENTKKVLEECKKNNAKR